VIVSNLDSYREALANLLTHSRRWRNTDDVLFLPGSVRYICRNLIQSHLAGCLNVRQFVLI